MLINRRRVKVSRRDAFLILFGVVFILIGYSLLSIPEESKPQLHALLRFALDVAPIEVYAWAWVGTGVLAVIGGLVHRLDWIGFAAAIFMPTIWSLAYWAAQIQDGVPRSWVGGTIYALMAGAIFLVSGMPDPMDVLDRRRSR